MKPARTGAGSSVPLRSLWSLLQQYLFQIIDNDGVVPDQLRAHRTIEQVFFELKPLSSGQFIEQILIYRFGLFCQFVVHSVTV
jgi:hypothetical protein